MRLFKQHQIRQCISLNGPWEFYFPQTGTDILLENYRDGEKEILEVPAVWESLNSRVNYRGQAVAKKMIQIDQDTPARLVFKGVSHTTTVTLDGEQVGFHHNAFTPFQVDLPCLTAGEHELALHITNGFGDLSALHIPNDYYSYGGITRPCGMELLGSPLVIRHVHVDTLNTNGAWSAACKVMIRNLSNDPVFASLTLTLAHASETAKEQAFPAGNSEISLTLTPEAVTPWCCDTPMLYTLNTTLHAEGSPIDDYRERIGFRTFRVEGEKILLNNQAIFPMGFNRHEDHAEYGCAIPVAAMRKDLALMQEMNCNAVRTSHYPNDERFLDLCDELGVMVWEENHARGLQGPKMHHPRFRDQCETCNEEMVREHYNHPSIIMWGLLNECDSGTEEGAALYQEQVDQLRSLDASRPITFASCMHDKDLCQGMVDITGWNLYSRWYSDLDDRKTVDELIARMEPVGMAGKPLILSEFGAGALPGFSDPVRKAKWSLERQAIIIEDALTCYLNHPRITGAFIWQFCDVKVTEENWGVNRPRCMNNKGIVDEYRQIKPAFEVVKRLFGERGQKR